MKPIQNAAASLLRRWRRNKVITLAPVPLPSAEETIAVLFAQPPLIDFTDLPTLPQRPTVSLQALKTHTRKVTTLPLGQWLARETIWSDPATHQVYASADLRPLDLGGIAARPRLWLPF